MAMGNRGRLVSCFQIDAILGNRGNHTDCFLASLGLIERL